MGQGVRVFAELLDGLAFCSSSYEKHAGKNEDGRNYRPPTPAFVKDDRRNSKSEQRLHVNVDRNRTRSDPRQCPGIQIVSADCRE